MEYKNALDFLLYSYFGFDGGTKKIEENKNEIPTYCANRAYLDLARTVEFKYSKSKLDKMKKKNSPQNVKVCLLLLMAKSATIMILMNGTKKSVNPLKTI